MEDMKKEYEQRDQINQKKIAELQEEKINISTSLTDIYALNSLSLVCLVAQINKIVSLFKRTKKKAPIKVEDFKSHLWMKMLELVFQYALH